MRELWKIVSVVTLTVVAYLFLSLATQPGLVPFEYAAYPVDDSLVSTDREVGREVSYVLWEQRYMDTTILAFLLFVAVACCASMLGQEK